MPARRNRLLVVIGTRPEAIKLAPVLAALREQAWAEVRVIATAQHRQLLDPVLAFFGIEPDVDLDLMRADQSLADLTARTLSALDPILTKERPDLVLAQGDTTSVMVAALACFYRRIPLGHVEAGLRTGDLRDPFPEEMNRVLVGRVADLHFAPTPAAAHNLRTEGVGGAVHVTGNTSVDALLSTARRVGPSRYCPPAGRRLLLVTAHRRESFGAPLASICHALCDLADRGDIRILFPVHPNPNVRATTERLLADHPAIDTVEPLDYPEMVAAMHACHLILTDSGGIQEEAPSLGKPVLVLRATTERPEGIAAGTARLVGTDRRAIVAAATELLDDAPAHAAMVAARNPYGDGDAAPRIADLCRAFLTGTERD